MFLGVIIKPPEFEEEPTDWEVAINQDNRTKVAVRMLKIKNGSDKMEVIVTMDGLPLPNFMLGNVSITSAGS